MKIVYLLLAVMLLVSCAPSTHVAMMPNEPMFSKPFEANVKGALGFNHAEAQVALSVLPFMGITGGKYYGKGGGINITDYGINLFKSLNKKETVYASVAGGGEFGTVNCVFDVSAPNYMEKFKVDNKYTGYYLQSSLYFILNDNKYERIKISFSFKHKELFYSKFNIKHTVSTGMFSHSFEILHGSLNPGATVHTPFISIDHTKKRLGVYFHAQAGMNIVANSFKTTVLSFRGAYSDSEELRKFNHPLVPRLFLNIAIGLRIN